MTAYDEHDDVIQHGLSGDDSDGHDMIEGPIVGIVLSVHEADDRTGNRWFQMLQTDQGEARAPWHELTIWAVYGSAPLAFQIPHVVVMPSGKTSRIGPTEDEQPDVSEDVPQGSTSIEVENFFNLEGSRGRIDTLSGDWVIVDFIGGLVTQGIMRDWYPSPFLVGDQAGKKADGARWRVRRAGTEQKIDKNGDFTLTHRRGTFVQVRGDELTIKHKDGSMIHFDEDSEISIVEKGGTNISLSNETVDISNGKVALSISGSNVQVLAPNGSASIMAQNVDLVGDVTASGGPASSIQSLLTEDFMSSLSSILSPAVAKSFLTGANALLSTPVLPDITDLSKLKVLWTALAALLTGLAADLATGVSTPPGPTNKKKTKDFTAS